MKYQSLTIQQIGQLFDGPHATPKPSEDGPIFLGIKNITDDGHLDLSQIRHVSEDEFPRWTRRVLPQENDLVLTYEATLHRYALIPDDFRGCLGRRVALLRPNQSVVVPRYLLYYFLSPIWKSQIIANTLTGATVDRIPLTNFPKFTVELPPIPTQERIVEVLGAYDDLIAVNERRIALLEEAIQLLYREWFVQLRFPGHEGVEISAEGIPAGWQLLPLQNVAEVNQKSITKRKAPANINYIDISSVSTGIVNQITPMPFSEAPSRARRIVQHGDVIWSCVRPNRKSYSLILNPEENTIASTGFAVLTAQNVPFVYLYGTVTTPEYVGYLTKVAKGAAYPAVSGKDFEQSEILMPTSDILADFERLTLPIATQIQKLRLQNISLREARDALLPRLMSGKLEV